MNEKEFLTLLSTFDPFGPVRLKLLLSFFGSAKKVWGLKSSELTKVGLSQIVTGQFIKHRSSFDAQGYFKKLDHLSIKVLTLFDEGYPENLKALPDAPYVLYVRGTLKKTDNQAVAIIGSRVMTSYGRDVTQKFATQLSNFGITVISGLALGVDAEAQRAAILAGGRTIAVLASGLDIITPLTNQALAMKFIKGSGALISEYPLGHRPFRSDFAVRNRLISGLAKAVIVIEGRMKSGTFYTVNAAAAQGRPVFAVPGPITAPTSQAPNYLIQNGAKLITSVKDVLDELDLQLKVDHEALERVMPASKDEAKLLAVLENEPLHLDELARISTLEVGTLSARLTIMELKGLVKNLGQGVYKKI